MILSWVSASWLLVVLCSAGLQLLDGMINSL